MVILLNSSVFHPEEHLHQNSLFLLSPSTLDRKLSAIYIEISHSILNIESHNHGRASANYDYRFSESGLLAQIFVSIFYVKLFDTIVVNAKIKETLKKKRLTCLNYTIA